MKSIAYGLCVVFLAVCLGGCTPSPDELRSTGISEYQVGHHDRAQTMFQRVLDKYPCDADSLYYMGRIAHAQKEYVKAMYYYQAAIDADPGYAPAKHYLKEAEKEAGDLAGYLKYIPPQHDKILP